MERSEQINELATALSKAQGAIENALKDSANPFFKSKYADLASVREAVRIPLASNGLCVMQFPTADGAAVKLTTVLAHASGQWISDGLTVTAKDDSPQAIGSAITYARRYALQAICGVAPEDDDGEAAQGRPAQAKQTKQQKDVASEKIAEMKSGKPYTDSGATAAALQQMRKQFEGLREHMGSKSFTAVLGQHGYTEIAEIPDIDTGRRVYKALIEAFEDEKKVKL